MGRHVEGCGDGRDEQREPVAKLMRPRVQDDQNGHASAIESRITSRMRVTLAASLAASRRFETVNDRISGASSGGGWSYTPMISVGAGRMPVYQTQYAPSPGLRSPGASPSA